MVTDQPAATVAEVREVWLAVANRAPGQAARFEGMLESVRAEERERAAALLDGIDRTQDDGGWWETSTGTEHGAAILAAIRAGSVDTHTDTPGEDTRG